MSKSLLGKKRTERNFENEEYDKFSNIHEDKNNNENKLPFKKIITEKITDYEIISNSNNDNNKKSENINKNLFGENKKDSLFNNKIEIKNEIKKDEKINKNLDTPIFGLNKSNINLFAENESKKKLFDEKKEEKLNNNSNETNKNPQHSLFEGNQEKNLKNNNNNNNNNNSTLNLFNSTNSILFENNSKEKTNSNNNNKNSSFSLFNNNNNKNEEKNETKKEISLFENNNNNNSSNGLFKNEGNSLFGNNNNSNSLFKNNLFENVSSKNDSIFSPKTTNSLFNNSNNQSLFNNSKNEEKNSKNLFSNFEKNNDKNLFGNNLFSNNNNNNNNGKLFNHSNNLFNFNNVENNSNFLSNKNNNENKEENSESDEFFNEENKQKENKTIIELKKEDENYIRKYSKNIDDIFVFSNEKKKYISRGNGIISIEFSKEKSKQKIAILIFRNQTGKILIESCFNKSFNNFKVYMKGLKNIAEFSVIEIKENNGKNFCLIRIPFSNQEDLKEFNSIYDEAIKFIS